MAKRKITVTVDEALVASVHLLGAESLSSVVNAALAVEVDRRARAAALARTLSEWDARLGPVGPDAIAAARAAFDDLDAVDTPHTAGTPGAHEPVGPTATPGPAAAAPASPRRGTSPRRARGAA